MKPKMEFINVQVIKVFLVSLISLSFYFNSYGQSCDCPAKEDCGPCEGGLTSLTIKYKGGAVLGLTITVSDGGGTIFSNLGILQGSTPFTVQSSAGAGNLFVGNYVQISGSGLFNETLSTDCSDAVTPGTVYQYFDIISSVDLTSGSICCLNSDEPSNPPSISNCPSDITLSSNTSCQAIATWAPPTANNANCGNIHSAQISGDYESGDIFEFGTTTVTYTAVDDYGNTATCIFNVIVEDDTPPVLNCSSNSDVTVNTNCTFSIPDYTAIGATDNCDTDVTVTQDPPAGTIISGLGTVTTITLTATDNEGLTNICTFEITLIDETAPEITCPGDQTVFVDTDCEAVLPDFTSLALISDNCDGSSIVTQNPLPGTTISGTTLISLSVKDASDNFRTCSFDVVVVDNTDPIISGMPADIVIASDASDCNRSVIWTAPTANDNCGVASFISDHSSGDDFPVGETIVTYTAIDAAGNEVAEIFTVTVSDEIVPVISGMPADIVVASDAADFIRSVTWIEPTADDNCTVASFTSNYDPGDNFPVGETTVTYTAIDAAGNDISESFTITVNDETEPIISGMPTDIVITSDATDCSPSVTWTEPTAIDNYAITTFISDYNPGKDFPVGVTTVTYTAIDAAGNDISESFKVIVNDETPPIFANCPSDIEYILDSNSCEYIVTWPEITATDNCDNNVTITSTPESGHAFEAGDTPVTFTATDDAGNTATCTFNVNIIDNIAPVFLSFPSDQNLNHFPETVCGAIATWEEPEVYDNCSYTIERSHISGSFFPRGANIVSYTARDLSGNETTRTFKIISNDKTKPILTGCPTEDIIVETTGNCETVVIWDPITASDECGAPYLTSSHEPGDTFPIGTTKVEYEATDSTGNSVQCSFNVVVSETTEPVIMNCPSDIEVYADNNCQAFATWAEPTANDNCISLDFVTNYEPGTLFYFGTTTVIYTATDLSGNTVECSFMVTVLDNTEPVILMCNNDEVRSLNENCQYILEDFTGLITADDNCISTDNILYTQIPAPGTTLEGARIHPITLIATDSAGNSSECTFNIDLKDEIAPVITNCAEDVVRTIDSNSCGYILEDFISFINAEDNCSSHEKISYAQIPSAGTILEGAGQHQITIVATDSSGNSTECTFNLTLEDSTSPIFTICQEDVVKIIDGIGCRYTLEDFTNVVSANDNCSFNDNIEYIQSPAIGSILSIGDHTITITATDEDDNSSTCTFIITLEDKSAPVIASCAEDVVRTIDSNSCGYILEDFISFISSEDNCSSDEMISYAQIPPVGTTLEGVGQHSITLIATDSSGNSTECTFNITLEDNTAPVFAICQEDVVKTIESNGCGYILEDFTNVVNANDNCSSNDIIEYVQSPAIGSILSIGDHTITITATDEDDNSSTCTFIIALEDKTAPLITNCAEDIVRSIDSNSCGYALEDFIGILNASDNCTSIEEISYAQEPLPGTLLEGTGNHSITIIATDEYNNSSECTFNITLEDNTSPVITSCQEDISRSIDSNSCGYTLEDFTSSLISSDNCSVNINLTQSPIAGTILEGDGFVHAILITATDPSGNSTSCTFDITLEDNISPEFTSCQENVTRLIDIESCEYTLEDFTSNLTVADNCSTSENIIYSQYPSAGTVLEVGVHTITLTATDQNDNVSNCTFNVTLMAEQSPVIMGCLEDMILKADGSGQVRGEWTEPTAEAACGNVELTSNFSSGDIFPIGTTEVEYTATNEWGNTAKCRFNVVVSYDEIDIGIVKVITPDGDGTNDTWEISNIEKYSNNKVTIIDRWGGIVFSASGYNNNNVVWNGTNQNGTLLPTGTYYYQITVSHAMDVEERRGFIELIR